MAQEVSQLLGRVFAQRRQSGRTDLEAVETAVRAAVHHAGAAALSDLLQYAVPAPAQRHVPCPCGHQAQYRGLRSKPVLTIVGWVKISRPYYRCAHCHQGQFPAAGELDVEDTEVSPGVRRMLAVVGAAAPFDHGRTQLAVLAGLAVTTKAVERTAEAIGGDIASGEQRERDRARQGELPAIGDDRGRIQSGQMDGTGVPVVKKETVGRPGKTTDQPAHTREAKLGCVFTQTGWDPKGYPIRAADSTTYTGAIEPAEAFGQRIYLEAWKRGWSRAPEKVVMGDGAEWIWNIADEHFPGAVQIVDLYHARQHLWELARKLHPIDAVKQKRWMLVQQHRLDGGQIEKLVLTLRAIATPPSGGGREDSYGG